MKPIEESLQELTTVYGPEIMLNACRNILAKYPVAPESAATIIFMAGDQLKDNLEAIAEKLDDVLSGTLHDFEDVVTKAKAVPSVPFQYEKLLSPGMLLETIDNLDGSVTDLMSQEFTLGDKADLLRKKWQLDTEIKLIEAAAVMRPEFLLLKNDTLRDAYRRTESADLRTNLAEIEGELAALDVEVAHERSKRETLRAAADSVQRKASLQTALLNFLSGGKV